MSKFYGPARAGPTEVFLTFVSERPSGRRAGPEQGDGLPAPAGVAARPDWALGLAFGVGGLAGAYLGARVQKHVPQRWLKGFLGLLLAGLAAHYLWPGNPG